MDSEVGGIIGTGKRIGKLIRTPFEFGRYTIHLCDSRVGPQGLWRTSCYAQILISQAEQRYDGESFATELDQTLDALDPTIIDLCLYLLPWAKIRKHEGALDLHSLLNQLSDFPATAPSPAP